jgi:CRISPR system Cascade subunit CasB
MYRYLRELAWFGPDQEKDAFLVASLFALHPHSPPGGDRDAGRARWTQNLGNSLSWLVVGLNRYQRSAPSSTHRAAHPGIERRFVALLAADRGDLLRQHAIPVNWLQLLRDLGAWERPDRDVQRRWARSFWGSTMSLPEDRTGPVATSHEPEDE